MTTLRVALILFASFRVAVCIPLRDFFSFGRFAQLDSTLPRNDDGSSPAIDLSVIFPYFDRNYRVVYVSYKDILAIAIHALCDIQLLPAVLRSCSYEDI